MNQAISLLVMFDDLMFAPLLDSALKGTILLLLAGFASWLLRRDSAATRHLVWAVAVCLMIAMPVLSMALPDWRILPRWPQMLVASNALSLPREFTQPELIVPTDPDAATFTSAASSPQPPAQLDNAPAQSIAMVAPLTANSIVPLTHTESSSVAPSPIRWTVVLSAIWLAGSTLLLLRLLVAAVVLRRLAKRAANLSSDADLQHEILQRLRPNLEQAKLSLGLQRNIALLLDCHRSIPIVWGLWRTRLQLPLEALHWNKEQLQSVLLHELAHVRRNDLQLLAVTQLACVLCWFHPLVWFAIWRLHVERERACDDLVLHHGVRPSTYAGHLLDFATSLNSSAWTRACGLAMARNSSLHGRLQAVLGKNINRRSASWHMFYSVILLGASISIPVAMLQSADETLGSRNVHPSQSTTATTQQTDPNKIHLGAHFEPHFDWSEPVNGLRAAVRIRTVDSPGVLGLERKIFLVLQNVSDKPIRFCDMNMAGGDALKSDIDKHSVYLRSNNETLSALSSADSTRTDVTLQPREMMELDLFAQPQPSDRSPRVGDLIAEGIIKYPNYDLYATIVLNNAPEGAWTGKLKTPATRGAFAATGPLPNDEMGKKLFRFCLDHARLNGDIPGGLLAQLNEMVQEFIRINTGDQYGDPYAKKMQPLLARFEHDGDWGQAAVVTLFDDIAAVTSIPLERTLELIRESTLQRGQPLPTSLNNANWGKTLESGLRMAWTLEPHADRYHLGSLLRSNVVIHNSGEEPVMFVTRSFHQPEHTATTDVGAAVTIESTHWLTLGRPEPYRLHPGEYCQVYAPGIGIGARNNIIDDWSNIHAGSWILATKGDSLIFQPGPILLTGDHNDTFDRNWWLKFIIKRINRDAPLPNDAQEREVILFRIVSDLFGSTPTPAEAEAFLADHTSRAIGNLAELLARRSWHSSAAGPIESGEIKFQVLGEDPQAATRPRIVLNPGRYNLGDETRLVVTRRQEGQRVINEADIIWYPPGKENVVTPVALPDGLSSWVAGWAPETTVLWISQSGLLRSYDFTEPAAVKETRFESDQLATAPIPSDVRQSLQAALAFPEPSR